MHNPLLFSFSLAVIILVFLLAYYSVVFFFTGCYYPRFFYLHNPLLFSFSLAVIILVFLLAYSSAVFFFTGCYYPRFSICIILCCFLFHWLLLFSFFYLHNPLLFSFSLAVVILVSLLAYFSVVFFFTGCFYSRFSICIILCCFLFHWLLLSSFFYLHNPLLFSFSLAVIMLVFLFA